MHLRSIGFPAPVVHAFPLKHDTNFRPVLDFHCVSLPSSRCERNGAQEQPRGHRLFCSMSAFSRNNGGWKRGFTLHLTQSNHPEKSSPCLLPLACRTECLCGFRLCPSWAGCCNPCVRLSGQQAGGNTWLGR